MCILPFIEFISVPSQLMLLLRLVENMALWGHVPP